jgi:hypothetical protein
MNVELLTKLAFSQSSITIDDPSQYRLGQAL